MCPRTQTIDLPLQVTVAWLCLVVIKVTQCLIGHWTPISFFECVYQKSVTFTLLLLSSNRYLNEPLPDGIAVFITTQSGCWRPLNITEAHNCPVKAVVRFARDLVRWNNESLMGIDLSLYSVELICLETTLENTELFTISVAGKSRLFGQ